MQRPGPELSRRGCGRAFSLTELLVVIALVAALSGWLLGAGRDAIARGREARARAELAVIAAALLDYRGREGDFPRTADPGQLLQALLGVRDPLGAVIPGTPHLDWGRLTVAGDPMAEATAVILDPWGRPYRYAYKSEPGWTNPGFVLFSPGSDGQCQPLLAGGYPDLSAPAGADDLHALP